MNPLLQFLLPIVLAVLCVFVAGIYILNRGRGMCFRDTLRETLMWGGGFIIYAVFDYLILMR